MKKNSLKKCIYSLLFFAVTFTMAGCGKTKVDLNKYLIINENGYDTLGAAYASIDIDAFSKDMNDKLDASKEVKAKAQSKGYTIPELLIKTCVDGKLNRNSGLKNGDKINYAWKCDTAKADEFFNCELVFSDVEHEVSELKAVEMFDPFQYITVEFVGTEPFGEYVIQPDLTNEVMAEFNIKVSDDKNRALSNNDTVKVEANLRNSVEGFVEEYGKIPSVTEKEYQVTGLSKYVQATTMIDETSLENMKKQAADIFTSNVAEWSTSSYLDSVEYIGNYFLYQKDFSERLKQYNEMDLIYKVNMHLDNGYDRADVEYYYLVGYPNITLDSEGKVNVDFMNYYNLKDYYSAKFRKSLSRGKHSWYDDYFTFYGYESYDDLKKSWLDSNMEKYYCENNVVIPEVAPETAPEAE